jgi:hypothetical protein
MYYVNIDLKFENLNNYSTIVYLLLKCLYIITKVIKHDNFEQIPWFDTR